jgi:hypothetical protein
MLREINVYVHVKVKGLGPHLYTTRVKVCDCGDMKQGVEQDWAAPSQVVPVSVNEGIEGQAIPPAGGEILDVHLRITGSEEGEKEAEMESQEGRVGGRWRKMDIPCIHRQIDTQTCTHTARQIDTARLNKTDGWEEPGR